MRTGSTCLTLEQISCDKASTTQLDILTPLRSAAAPSLSHFFACFKFQLLLCSHRLTFSPEHDAFHWFTFSIVLTQTTPGDIKATHLIFFDCNISEDRFLRETTHTACFMQLSTPLNTAAALFSVQKSSQPQHSSTRNACEQPVQLHRGPHQLTG